MRPWLFELGGLALPAYWALLGIGFAAAFGVAFREARRDGLDPNRMLDVGLAALVAGLIGARLMHALLEPDPATGGPILDHTLAHPFDLVTRGNGTALFGGLLLGTPAVLLTARLRGLPVLRTADIAALAAPVAIFFGRLGCLLTGCCHGKPTELPWGVTFSDPNSLARPLGVPLHPTQVYEALLALGLFGGLLAFKRRGLHPPSQVLLLFAAFYAAGRFFLEYFRNDLRGEHWGLSSSQLVAIPVFLGAAVLLAVTSRRTPAG